MGEKNIFESYHWFRKQYPYVITEMKKNLGKKWDTGDFIGDFVNVGFPCEVQDVISGILTEIKRRGEDITPYLKDLEPLDREVEEFIKEHLDIYLEHLEAQLKNSIKMFVPSNFLDEWDFENHIGIRSSFESYLHELEKYHHDIREYRKQINVIDEEFRKSIPKAIEDKLYLPNDHPWAPTEYWWDHLEEQYGYPDEFID